MGDSAYMHVPLADISASVRGKVLEKLTRTVCALATPSSIFEDPILGKRINGASRGVYDAEYDWLCDGLRIECKSAQLQWNKDKKSWLFGFSNVKIGCTTRQNEAAFDNLVLALYSPRGVHIIAHDLITGVSSNGKATVSDGFKIYLGSEKWEVDW